MYCDELESSIDDPPDTLGKLETAFCAGSGLVVQDLAFCAGSCLGKFG
jgi:hypothetical protein